MVLVARAGVDGASDQSIDSEEEQEQELLTARLAGKVVKLAGQQDVDSLCESAASLLAFGEREQRGEDTVVDGNAPRAAAAVETAEPPAMLSDADMMMVCRLKLTMVTAAVVLSLGSRC